MKGKFVKLVCSFLIVMEFLFSFMTMPVTVIKAADTPDPGPGTSRFTADTGGQTITDTWKSLVYGTKVRHLKFFFISGPNLYYSFNEFTYADGKEFYLGIDSSTLQVTGVFLLDRKDNKFYPLALDRSGSISGHANIETMGLPALDTTISWADYFEMIYAIEVNYMTPSTVPDTAATINCPTLKLGTIAYDGQSTLAQTDFKDTGDEYTRFKAGLPPKDAIMRIYYRPPGSPVYLPDSVYGGGGIMGTLHHEFRMDIASSTFPLVTGALKPGNYMIYTAFGLKQDDKTKKYQFDNFDGYGNVGTELDRMKYSLPVMAAAVVATNLIPPVALLQLPVFQYIESSKADLHYYGYEGKTEVTVAAGQTTAVPCPTVNPVRATGLDSTDGTNSTDYCNTAKAGNIISDMIASAFCGLAVVLKKWADGAYCWSLGLLESSIGVASEQTTSVTKPGVCSIDNTSTTATTTTTTATPTGAPLSVNYSMTLSSSAYSSLKAAATPPGSGVWLTARKTGATTGDIAGTITLSGWDNTNHTVSANLQTSAVIPTDWSAITISGGAKTSGGGNGTDILYKLNGTKGANNSWSVSPAN